MKKKNKEKLDRNKEIDKNIRKAFGKFYVYSVIIILCLAIYPFLIKRLKAWFSILLLIFFAVFYIYMIRDLLRKRSNYWTALTSIFIFIFVIIMTLDIIKIVFFLLK